MKTIGIRSIALAALTTGILLSGGSAFAQTYDPTTTPWETKQDCIDSYIRNEQQLTAPIYSSRTDNPCPVATGPAGWVWGRVTSRSYACAYKRITYGIWGWFIVMASESITSRLVYVAAGTGSRGFFCNSTPYEATNVTTNYAYSGYPYGISRTTWANTPISQNHTPEYVAIYGIPKYWAQTKYTTTTEYVNNSNISSNQVGYPYAHGTINWNY